ncbi:membrane protein of unknown function [Rhodovastum atsumiense]|nr:DUF4328 domain-containing protein [Rhodovastum atsumiense]CAH2601760.1 membrane protein of unknown function [Rhodovastum atsumiense]
MPRHSHDRFHDLGGLTKWTGRLLQLAIAVCTVAVVWNVTTTIQLLRLGPAAEEDAASLTPLRLGTGLATGILLLAWTWSANRNAHGLGAAGLRFTPGWSAGWYVVPLANLWKPLQVLREIWQASSDPRHWKGEAVPTAITWWWRLVLSAAALAALATLGPAPEDVAGLVSSHLLIILTDIATIVAAGLLRVIITDIGRMQASHAERQGLIA